MKLVTARKQSLGQGNIFTPVCHSVYGGGVWFQGYTCSQGDACSWGTACSGGVPRPGGVPGPGRVCSGGVPGPGGSGPRVCLLGGGPAPRGWLVETPPDGHCCRQYASYWNAFLLCYQLTSKKVISPCFIKYTKWFS